MSSQSVGGGPRSDLVPAAICPHCGAVGSGVAGFCGRCGRGLDRRPSAPPALRRCPACGAPAPDDGRRTCPSCGLTLVAEPEPEPPAPRRRRRWPLLLAVPAAGALVAAVLTFRADGDPALVAQWQLEVGAELTGAPVVVGRTVLVATADGSVVAAGLLDGRARWRFAAGEELALPLAAGEDVALVAAGTDLFAVDVRTGAERWRGAELGAISVVVVGDAAYASTGAGDVLALDLATGAERWRRQVPAAGPLAVADNVVVVATAGGMEALDALTGEPRWTWSGEGPGPPAPLAVANVVVVDGDAGELIALALADGTERWRAPSGEATPRRSGAGAVVVRAGADDLVAVAADTGRIRWRGGPGGAAVATDGTLVAASVPNRLTVLDADTGETEGAANLPHSGAEPAPVVAGLQVVVATGRHLLAYTV